jgi:hypothetical protein
MTRIRVKKGIRNVSSRFAAGECRRYHLGIGNRCAVGAGGLIMNRALGLGALAIAGTIGVALGSALPQPSVDAEQHTRTVVLTQQPPTLHPIDLHIEGASVGDMVLYEATIAGEQGETGLLTGFLITADIPDAATGDVHQDRLGQLSFDLGNGTSLVVAGEAIYPGEDVEMTENAEQRRAVVGGTGDFMGARGEVTTTRNADGSYQHAFTLLDD